jgi:2-dehydropantoate 2-reductase
MTNTASPKIVIAGAGSIGCYVGGMLATANNNVHFFARPRIADDLQKNGLQLSDWTGRREKLTPERLSISTDASILKDADLILICVKSKDSKEMAQTILESGNTTATIFSCQNGVSNVEAIQSVLPNHTVLPVMVPYNVVYTVGGRFHCGTEGELYCQDDENAQILKQAADNAQLALELKPDMPSILWGKLLLNLNNPVNALSGIPLKQQLETRAYRKIYGQCLKEGLAVLKAANIKPGKVAAVPVGVIPFILALPDFLFKRIAQKMLAIDPQARSSMWEDLKNQRPVEVDYITGEIIKLGERLGIPTPMNQRLLQLVKQAQQDGKGSPNLPPSAILPN